MKMTKRMLMMTLILVVWVSTCYGAVPEAENEPFSLTVFRYMSTFEIDSNGSASGTLTVRPHPDSGLDEVVAIFEVEYMDDGERVFRQSKSLAYNQSEQRYFGEVTFDVEDSGTYSMGITFYCYSEDRLIETIRADEMVRTY